MKRFIKLVTARAPELNKVAATFGSILLIVHSYALVDYFYRVPSFLNYMDIGTLFGVLAYYMGFAFLESAVLLGLLTLLAILIPKKWYADHFSVMNFPIVTVLALSADRYQTQIKNAYTGILPIALWFGVTVALAVVMAVLFVKVTWLKRAAEFMMERVAIMNYIYVPIGLIALLVVGIRLVF